MELNFIHQRQFHSSKRKEKKTTQKHLIQIVHKNREKKTHFACAKMGEI